MTQSYVSALSRITGLPVEEIRERAESGGIDLSPEQMNELLAWVGERERAGFARAADEGDYSTALSRLGSGLVADGIVELDEVYGPLTDDELRAVLSEHWTRTDAPGDAVGALLALFWRAEYVSDTEHQLEGELTIYRATFGDDPRGGISWSLSEAKARWFAERLSDADATIWRANVEASDVLGYFVEREEDEVVVDPGTLRKLERLA
jgi:hypothetical protein